jgi:CubicO group peptidase (beta-lactamase class C family)
MLQTCSRWCALAIITVLGTATPTRLAAQTPDRLDQLFRAMTGDTVPGCALGIDSAGVPVTRRAWGMTNLELAVPNTPETIFEAGSVSKQVTAAAVHLLAARGRIQLTDDVRQYFPELPVYDAPITLTHLLQHTSGLRDWGAIAGIQGWPRGTRVLNHQHVLDLIVRQRGLNHAVGAAYSYTNSGYSLLAMLVERVSGKSLAAFTAEEFFVPLQMAHTSWRDDFARVVPGRAQAYARQGAAWRLDMPFENPHGHGGLLTTIGDLLRWNAAMDARRLGSPDVSAAMEVRGVLRDGTPIRYAGGLTHGNWGGTPEIGHDGSTAGYRAHLARWPSVQASAVVLCNAATANATALVREAMRPVIFRSASPAQVSTNDLVGIDRTIRVRAADYVGIWTSEEADARWLIHGSDDSLRLSRTAGESLNMLAVAADSFRVSSGVSIKFSRDAGGHVTAAHVSVPRALNVPFRRAP